VHRRTFLRTVVGTLLAVPRAAEAQRTRIGVLAHDLQPGLLEVFRDELQRLGYTEGRNITIDVRSAGGRSDRLQALVENLLQLNVAAIVAVNTPAAKAAKTATSTIPIVIMRVADPVAQGLVTSLARPGGNVTGLSFMPDELGAKAVEVLHEILPGVTRVASLYKGDNPGALLVVTETERRSVQLGLRFVRLPVIEPADFPGAFQTATRARAEALFVMDDGAITQHRKQLSELAARHSLPVVSIYRDFAEAGGFIAYGPDLPTMYRSGARYIDRILKGAKPAHLPLEQPTKFHLVVNLKTAKALGLTIPPSLLQRADQVIE
jgi:putative tryptophan/tyrosine transport system substrate-binding protein